jgi:hypothetical protein
MNLFEDPEFQQWLKDPEFQQWLKDPEFQQWLKKQGHNLEMLRKSALSITICDGSASPELCLQLGAAIMYGKPIILVVLDGVQLPPRLENLADAVVRGSMEDSTVQDRLREAVMKVIPHRA